MRILHIILILLLFSSTVFGQIKRNDIIGEWQTKNDDSLYYHSDTIKLYKDINHFYNTETCHLIRWTIDRRNFKLSKILTCSEPGRVSSFTDKEKIKIKNTDYGQVLTLERNGQVFDKFKIIDFQVKQVDRYPHEIKELSLMRFDKLSEYKLLSYVDSLINNLSNNVEDSEPPIVINGYVIEDKEILKHIKLAETLSIEVIHKKTSEQVFDKARNGVILISVSQKKFKNKWKNYGR